MQKNIFTIVTVAVALASLVGAYFIGYSKGISQTQTSYESQLGQIKSRLPAGWKPLK